MASNGLVYNTRIRRPNTTQVDLDATSRNPIPLGYKCHGFARKTVARNYQLSANHHIDYRSFHRRNIFLKFQTIHDDNKPIGKDNHVKRQLLRILA